MKKLTHEQGWNFLTTLVTLIYNFVKALKKQPTDTE